MSSSSKSGRVDKNFEAKAREILRERVGKGLSPCNSKNLGLPKLTELMMRCPSWRTLEGELRTLPEKKKNGK